MIKSLQDYAEKWNNVANIYEEEQDRLIAAMVLGQEWETDILTMRQDTLDDFTNAYLDLQKNMADAAWNAANEAVAALRKQVDEAKSALAELNSLTGGNAGGGSGSGGGSGAGTPPNLGDSSTDNTQGNDKPKNTVYQVVSQGRVVQEFNTLSQAEGLMRNSGGTFGGNPASIIKFNKYHTGLEQGLVNKHSFDDDFETVQKAGLSKNEVPAILKVGEAVLTPLQIENLADKLRMLSGIQNMMNSNHLDYSKMANNNISNRDPVVLTQNVTITCPNVTNDAGIEYINKSLGNLSQKAYQMIHNK